MTVSIPTSPKHFRPDAALLAGLSLLVLVLSCLVPSNKPTLSSVGIKRSEALSTEAPYSCKSDIQYWFLYLKWGVCHGKVKGCRFVSDYQQGARLLAQRRPIGLTREQCSQLFGRPNNIYLEKQSVAAKSFLHGELWFYDEGINPLHIGLQFNREKCVGVLLLTPVCNDCMAHLHERGPLLDRLFRISRAPTMAIEHRWPSAICCWYPLIARPQQLATYDAAKARARLGNA